jgi:hypothetical protein
MWHLDLALPEGDHTAETRATDKSGTPDRQTRRGDPQRRHRMARRPLDRRLTSA